MHGPLLVCACMCIYTVYMHIYLCVLSESSEMKPLAENELSQSLQSDLTYTLLRQQIYAVALHAECVGRFRQSL